MLRFKDSQLWKDLTFHFRCKNKINSQQEQLRSYVESLTNSRNECETLRTQVEEAKAIFDAMDKKHVEDKEAMALEIETMRSDHLKLVGDLRLAEAEIKATNKHAYDANKATENLKLERQHLIGIVEGLKEDFKQYKEGAPAIMAQGETLTARLEKNDAHYGNSRTKYTTGEIVENTIIQEASALSENAKQIIKDINELSSSPSPLTEAIAEAYLFEQHNDNNIMPLVLNDKNSPEYFNKKKRKNKR